MDVDDLNLKMQQPLPSDYVSHLSINTFCDANEAGNYPTVTLNPLDWPDMPQYLMQLNVGPPVMLLRKLNPPQMCNGTRLVIKAIMNGKFRGENVFIHA